MMDVSLVILNYNGKDKLKILLDSIKRIKITLKYEVIVLDNASTDGSIKFIEQNYPWVRILKNKTNEGYPALNMAIDFTDSKYLLLLNNDMQLTENCIEHLFKIAETEKNAALICPRIIDFYNKKLSSYGTFLSRSFYSGYVMNKSFDFKREIPYSGVGLFRRKIISEIGYLFDEDYFLYAEDVDLGLRIRLLGFNVLYVPEAVLYHMHPLIVGKVAAPSRIVYLMERNMLTTFFKILEWKSIFYLSPYVFGMRFAAMIKDLTGLRFSSISARLKAIFWIPLNFKKIMKKRRDIQKNRKINDKELFKLFTEKFIFK